MTAPTPPEEAPQQQGSFLRRMHLTNWQIILIALIVVGGRLVIDFSQRIVEGQQKASEQRHLEAEIEALLQEQKTLQAAKAYYTSPAFVEAWAHNEGKMVRQGEVLVVPIYKNPEEAVAAAHPQPVNEPLSPLSVWWTLFFEGSPPFSKR